MKSKTKPSSPKKSPKKNFDNADGAKEIEKAGKSPSRSEKVSALSHAGDLMGEAEDLFNQVIADQTRRDAEDLTEKTRPLLIKAIEISSQAARAYAHGGDYETARDLYEKCIALSAGYDLGSAKQNECLLALAEVFEELGDPAEAQACRDEAASGE